MSDSMYQSVAIASLFWAILTAEPLDFVLWYPRGHFICSTVGSNGQPSGCRQFPSEHAWQVQVTYKQISQIYDSLYHQVLSQCSAVYIRWKVASPAMSMIRPFRYKEQQQQQHQQQQQQQQQQQHYISGTWLTSQCTTVTLPLGN